MDYEEGWTQVKKKRFYMTSFKALGLQKTFHCAGLAAFLMGPEAYHYFNRGLKFYGIRYSTSTGESNKVIPLNRTPKTIHLTPVNNHYGDLAMFYDPSEN